jgi:hypothetical protein
VKRLIATCSILLLLVAPTAIAADSESQGPEDQTALIADAKLSDAKGLAEYAGISVTEALARNQDEAAVRDIGSTLDPNKFAGIYFTQDSKNYTLHIVAKEGANVTWPELPRLNVLKAVHETAPRSLNELLELRDAVSALDLAWWSEAVPNPATGKIDVVATSTAAVEAITKQFGDAVTVTLGEPLKTIACTNRNNCSPSRGGIFIATLTGDPFPKDYEACTFGFKAKGIATGTIKMLSAAHCNIDANPNVYHPILDGRNVELCPGGSNTVLYAGFYGDFMKCGDGTYLAPGNIVPHDYGANIAYPITTDRSWFTISNGNGCWMSGAGAGAGAASQYSTVAGAHGNFTISWSNHDPFYMAGFKCQHEAVKGDSGGPVYYDNGALGIMSAVGAGFTVAAYTDATYIDIALNIELCLNSNCSN